MKAKLILTKGLPGSGKTTWAKELLAKEPGKWKRINKDSLRAMLDNSAWGKENEQFVLSTRDQLILNALTQGYNVVIDDTNLHAKHFNHIKELLSETPFNDVEIEIKDFTDVPLEVCLERDYKRDGKERVGKKVIMRMYNQFLKPPIPKIEFDLKLPRAVLCDIDGTLALFPGKNPYERDFENDLLNSPIVGIISVMEDVGCQIILVSGRNSKFKEVTEQWLKKYSIIYHKLLMPRPTDDNRKDVIIKQEIYDEHIKGKYNVEFVLDDRDQVVNLWRSLGLTCLQVADGDF